jgi:hypothetical protein
MHEILQRFLDEAPIAVMVRATIARTISGSIVDEIFDRHASDQHTRELTFSTFSQELTESRRCEINTLGYPKAALFGFALAVVANNVLVVTRATMAAGLGEEIGGRDALSSYQMAVEVASVDKGLSIAVPASEWDKFVAMTLPEFAGWLHEVARGIDWRSYRKRPRGPKKPVAVKRTRRGAHRSTARELIKSQE